MFSFISCPGIFYRKKFQEPKSSRVHWRPLQDTFVPAGQSSWHHPLEAEIQEGFLISSCLLRFLAERSVSWIGAKSKEEKTLLVAFAPCRDGGMRVGTAWRRLLLRRAVPRHPTKSPVSAEKESFSVLSPLTLCILFSQQAQECQWKGELSLAARP